MNPIIIGGTGGSGTRLVAEIMRAGGVFIGNELNYALDALPYARLDDNYLNGKYITVERVRQAEEEHGVRGHPPARWGWKHTRSIMTLPMLYKFYPDMMLVHVLRDGRDLACAPHLGLSVLWNGNMLGLPSPEVTMMQWSVMNMQTQNWARNFLDISHYYSIRYEELISSPARWVDSLFDWCGLEGNVEAAAKVVRDTGKCGRWKGLLDGRAQEIGETALRRFGYK